MKYIVIGLGSFGSVLTAELTERGHDVICADNSQTRIESIKDKCASALNIDATDEIALSMLPLKTVDAVIVAIGEDLGASVKVVALLKKLGVEHIYARAMDSVHKSILQAFNIDRILLPEEDAAYALVRQMDYGANISTFALDQNNNIYKFPCPKSLVGKDVNEINLYEDFNLKLISVLKANAMVNCLGIEYYDCEQIKVTEGVCVLGANDKLVCMGKYSDFLKLCRKLT